MSPRGVHAPVVIPVQANDRITVLSKVNDEWLYGELNGKEGQFPATFVDRFPPNLPQKTSASAGTSEPTKEKVIFMCGCVGVCMHVCRMEAKGSNCGIQPPIGLVLVIY